MRRLAVLGLVFLLACQVQLSEDAARGLAMGSACTAEGSLAGEGYYNPNSRTWWFDINATVSGCSPACVVHENRSVEINWRCAGLLPE